MMHEAGFSMTRRALIVDDDKSMVKTLSDVLQFKGWEVATAYSGSEAVAAASARPFDVVLMDIKMPGMDGVDAFKAIKAKRPGIKVVLMTAYAAQDRVAEAEREGVLRVLPKPVNIGSLLDLLASSLNNNKPVLLVDSDAVFLKTLSEVLRLRGFETILAQNVEQAKRLMAERKPRAVLLHLRLGTASAREAIIAVHDISPSVALILYSGEPGAVEEAALGVPLSWIHAYLQKPFAVDQITGVLNAVRTDG
jgi:DNA-binding NtrC family response regulator